MATDLLAIADAIAARCAAVTVPTGEPAIVGSTARLPNNIPDTPYIIVTPPSGEMGMVEGFPSGRVRDVHDFDVYLLLNKASGELPADLYRIYLWWPVMRGALHGQIKLGLAPVVMKAAVTNSYDFDAYTYAGAEYHAWHFEVRVWTEDTVPVAV
ncbi:MAG: hypothetical protein M3N43_14705 [Actinomycetota bacterium]|nr:hypothetical protein [Actinomycetota bacterium]